jgi:transcriptional regulator with XRE-family HTH domain
MAKFRVKELAKARGMTSEELALKSGLKISTVRNLWQNRVNDPNYSTLLAIAGALEVKIEELEDKSGSDGVKSTDIRTPMSTLVLNPRG